LLQDRKLTSGTVVNRVAALRFFFVKTLKRHQFRELEPGLTGTEGIIVGPLPKFSGLLLRENTCGTNVARLRISVWFVGKQVSSAKQQSSHLKSVAAAKQFTPTVCRSPGFGLTA
jgi:hypothetical protein